MSRLTGDDVSVVLTPKAVRLSTKRVWDLCLAGKTHFKVHLDKIDDCADYVLEVIKQNYPDLEIPFHSRWGHFKAAGVDRVEGLKESLIGSDAMEVARTKFDLVITSVLLDAGAGKDWSYNEGGTKIPRSEGLAVASFHLFMEGAFSSEKLAVADAKGLVSFSQQDLKQGFQVSESNPLIGVDGRVELINKLGRVVENKKKYFPNERLGGLVDYLNDNFGKTLKASDLLQTVLYSLGDIWPGRINIEGTSLGDSWHYPPLGEELTLESVVSFHKLSQWLTYSLVTPLEEAGFNIIGAEELTGLAEYRNGGLFLDFGVLELKNSEDYLREHLPQSEFIIEWRALTVQLLDQVGVIIQKKLEKTAAEFPLAKVLEGGTWWAGRKIANEKRDGSNPIKIASDGTVF